MKYKIMTIAVASLLPLGFAATASATNLTASHGVTFTVAEARSISVTVAEGENNVLDFGVISTNGEVLLDRAVEVKFSTPSGGPNQDFIEVMLVDSGGLSAQLPLGVTMEASAGPIPGATGLTAGKDLDLSTGSGRILYEGFLDDYFQETFDVSFELITFDAAAGTGNYFIQYTLQED